MVPVLLRPALLSASKAMPPVSAPSPMTATLLLSRPASLSAVANPSASEMEVLLWPVPKQSYALS